MRSKKVKRSSSVTDPKTRTRSKPKKQDEAFAIWAEWESLYPTRSATHDLLHSIGENRWLVTVVHHDYKRENALWEFLGCGEAVGEGR